MNEVAINQEDISAVVFETVFAGKKQKAVDARELYYKLGLHKNGFTKWAKANIEAIFENGTEYVTRFERESPKQAKTMGRPRQIDYIVPINIAKELAMLARTPEGKMIRRQFIEIERLYMTERQPQFRAFELGEEAGKFFNGLLADVEKFSPTARVTLGAQIAEKIYGLKIPHTFLPPIDDKRKSASELAAEFGSTAQMVGRVANQLNLKRYPYGKALLSIAKYANKEVTMWYYNEEAQRRISEHLRGFVTE